MERKDENHNVSAEQAVDCTSSISEDQIRRMTVFEMSQQALGEIESMLNDLQLWSKKSGNSATEAVLWG